MLAREAEVAIFICAGSHAAYIEVVLLDEGLDHGVGPVVNKVGWKQTPLGFIPQMCQVSTASQVFLWSLHLIVIVDRRSRDFEVEIIFNDWIILDLKTALRAMLHLMSGVKRGPITCRPTNPHGPPVLRILVGWYDMSK
jgi:hypothetical protein